MELPQRGNKTFDFADGQTDTIQPNKPTAPTVAYVKQMNVKYEE